jgi:hypothetical protein
MYSAVAPRPQESRGDGIPLIKLGAGVFVELADHPRSGDREPTGKGAIMATVTKTAARGGTSTESYETTVN